MTGTAPAASNGFGNAPPPRGPAIGNHRGPPPPHPRGGHAPFQQRAPPPQMVPPRPQPPPQVRNGPTQPPVGPRRPSGVASPAAGTPSPAIPTGPRAGNFPYRSTLPVPAPPRYVPSGPGATIPGGRLLPSLDKASDERMSRLKSDQTKLDEELRSVQEKKRKGLMQWEKSRRESEREGFRVQTAESQLHADDVEMM